MSILKRIAAVYLILIAALAGVNWIATPLYDNSSGEYPVWVILDWFMAASIVLAAIENVRAKLATLGSDLYAPLTSRHVQVNLLFYGTIVLILWFFWNWFYAFFPHNEPQTVFPVHLEMWTLISPLFVLVAGVTGFSMWQDAGDTHG